MSVSINKQRHRVRNALVGLGMGTAPESLSEPVSARRRRMTATNFCADFPYLSTLPLVARFGS